LKFGDASLAQGETTDSRRFSLAASSARTLELITRALEAGGIEFTSGNNTAGLGVGLQRR